MVDRDDTDPDNNKHIRYLYFDIIGCLMSPTWSSTYNLGTFTYYIGGDDLVIEFTDWSNGNCEVSYTNTERSLWVESADWFTTTPPDYDYDNVYSTQMTVDDPGYVTISTNDPQYEGTWEFIIMYEAGSLEVRDNVIVGCSLDQSEITSPCHQDVEIWKTYDSASDSLTYTTQTLIHELYGSYTTAITANSDQADVDNILADDGDYWTTGTDEGITGSSTGYELEI